MSVLILTNEIIWHQLISRQTTHIFSPQLWDFEFKGDTCLYRSKEESGDSSQIQVEGILLREGHLYPNKEYRLLISKIEKSGLPCVNQSKTTLKCMDTVKVVEECQNNSLLSPFIETQIVDPVESNIQTPCVLKLPNFHGGIGKWLIKTEKDLKNLLNDQQIIQLGKNTVAKGYLTQEPYLSSKIMVEPIFSGEDLRLWVYLDRPDAKYRIKGLRRTVKTGEWLANRFTASYELFDNILPRYHDICMEAAQILHQPDLFAVDLMVDQNLNQIKILEINNDVPGLKSLEQSNDFRIHHALLNNLKYLINERQA